MFVLALFLDQVLIIFGFGRPNSSKKRLLVLKFHPTIFFIPYAGKSAFLLSGYGRPLSKQEFRMQRTIMQTHFLYVVLKPLT